MKKKPTATDCTFMLPPIEESFRVDVTKGLDQFMNHPTLRNMFEGNVPHVAYTDVVIRVQKPVQVGRRCNRYLAKKLLQNDIKAKFGKRVPLSRITLREVSDHADIAKVK